MHERDEVLIGDVFLSQTFPGKHLQGENTGLRSDGANPLESILLFETGTELFLIGSGPVEDICRRKPPGSVGPLMQRLLAKGLMLFLNISFLLLLHRSVPFLDGFLLSVY